MKKVLIFGGTTEGRQLAQMLAENEIYTQVHVATDYGEQLIESSEFIDVKTGRLTAEEIKTLFLENEYSAVIDATHPFATAVTQNILAGASLCKELPLIRFERNIELSKGSQSDQFSYFDSVEDCVRALENTNGNIFITTGSKDLSKFCANSAVKQRIIARILPATESLKICQDCGLDGRQIIAMQGPFSEKMNISQIEDYKIEILVSKESGATGGLDTKLSAAQKSGIKCFIIKKPVSENNHNKVVKVSSLKEAGNILETLLCKKITVNHKLKIVLAGIGMGNPDSMTVEVQKVISKADYIFGAKRMIEGIHSSAKKVDAYLAKDIMPQLIAIAESQTEDTKAVILFSGDTGFFSGAENLYNALSKNFQNVNILPGISSIQYLAAKAGISWQSSKILSTHGVPSEEWKEKLNSYLQTAKNGTQIYFITSGIEDVYELGTELEKSNLQLKLILGYQLSYDEEKIIKVSPSECKKLKNKGLYSGFIMVE